MPKDNMVLPDTKKKIIINAGHHKDDTGAVYNNIIERDECYKVRDELVPILKARGYEVVEIPDYLNLIQSIKLANRNAPNLNDGLAIDIHFNSLSDNSVGGTESFHGVSETSRKIAYALSRGISKALGTRNRGAKPDTQTAAGSLGWIRKTSMWASLVEICFITNDADMALVRARDGYKTAALGLADGIDKVFGHVPPVVEPPAVNDPAILKTFSDKQLLEELLRRK